MGFNSPQIHGSTVPSKTYLFFKRSHPVVFLERPGGMRVISSVMTMLSAIHYAGHQGPAKRFGEATHHLTHVIPVHLEWIPGQRASTVTLKYNHSILKWAVQKIYVPMFSQNWHLCSPWEYLGGGMCKKSTRFHIQASFCTDCGCKWWALFLLLLMVFWTALSSTGWQ